MKYFFYIAFSFLLMLFPLTTLAQDNLHNQGNMQTLKMPCKLLKGISEREYSIYLPGSYNTNNQKSYPVLYLMHGGGGSNTDWEKIHHLSEVANRLISNGNIDEMVIVCAEGNQQNMMYFNAERDNNGTPDWKYEDYFFNEFIPYIEKTYRVRTDKGGRAIGGFSMGGGAATVYGVHHPECFCMVYDISGYLRRQPLSFLKNDPSAAWRQQVIENNNPIVRVNSGTAEDVAAWKKTDWKIAVGDKDFTLEANMDLMKAFREKGVPCSMYVNDGAHDAKWVNSVLEDVLKRANKNFKSL
jgi:enterochelin esterase-like enzyme